MLANVHARGATREAWIEAVVAFLAEEGFTRVEDVASTDPSLRRIRLYASGGWVGLADDPEADMPWGEHLSKVLGVPVVAMSGECDHVFFSEVKLYEDGAELQASSVPEDAVLEDDGTHRIRPTFLASLVPAAKRKLEAGIVVNELGGEENMLAVGEALGIPRPCVSPYDEQSGDVVLVFRDDHADEEERDPLAGLRKALMKSFGAELEALAVRRATPALSGGSSSRESSIVGRTYRIRTTFEYDGPAAAKGLVVELSGDLELFDPPELEVVLEVAGARPFVAKAKKLSGRRRYTFSKLEIDGPTTVIVSAPSHLRKEGQGTLTIRASTVDPPDLTDTNTIELEIEPKPHVPIVPSFARGAGDVTHYVQAYGKRDLAVGWIAFDGKWSKVKAVAQRIAARVAETILEVTDAKAMSARVLQNGKYLTFRAVRIENKPAAGSPWARIQKALAAGADVELYTGEPFTAPRVEICHRPTGSNFGFPSVARTDRSCPTIVLAWSVPRPASPAGAKALAELGRWALEEAGATAGNLGGHATAQGVELQGAFHEVPYDTLAQTREGAVTTGWLRTHARTPGWAVLLPKLAGKKLAKTVPARVKRTKLAEGVLVTSTAKDMFTYEAKASAAMERYLLPAFGTRDDLPPR